MNKKSEVTVTRLSPEEFDKRSMDTRMAAMEKAEKVCYKSNCDSKKFKKFLEGRLTIWNELKDKTFYAKNMYEKTNTLLENWN